MMNVITLSPQAFSESTNFAVLYYMRIISNLLSWLLGEFQEFLFNSF